jgi:cyclophilin family peptidyl-prolyl cis-trans isomerase
MSKPENAFAARRALLGLIAASAAMAACGGGGDSSGPPVVTNPTPVEMVITHRLRVTTSMGQFELGLDRQHAPITVDNFLKYVDAGFYPGTLFHRVIANFVIQGGGVIRTAAGLAEKPPLYAPIKLEADNGLRNLRGTLAMARTGVLDSATSQFFINVVDNPTLNYPTQGGYAVFGRVTAGMEVVDAIRAVAVGTGDVPVSDVSITKVERL